MEQSQLLNMKRLLFAGLLFFSLSVYAQEREIKIIVNYDRKYKELIKNTAHYMIEFSEMENREYLSGNFKESDTIKFKCKFLDSTKIHISVDPVDNPFPFFSYTIKFIYDTCQ